MTVQELAKKYINSLSNPEFELREIEDAKDYYCFSYDHPTEIFVGQGLIFINKADSRFFIYGSGNVDAKTDYLEKIEQEKKVRTEFPDFDIRKSYNLKINRVLRKMLLIEKLIDLNFSYTKPEIVGSDIFRISKPYNSELFEKRLKDLPSVFMNITAEKIFEILILNDEKKVVDFTISEHIEIKKVSRIERASEIDLQTEW